MSSQSQPSRQSEPAKHTVKRAVRRTVKRASSRTSGRTGRSKQPEPERYERGTRSYTMSHIRGKDTKIEVLVRSYLFRHGLRFRKNDKRYPGHPDVVLPKYRTIVFVNGCFWHMHEGCAKHAMPKSNVEFWSAKLLRNHDRDVRQHAELRAAGWKVIVVWECELAKPVREERLARLVREITGMAGDDTSEDDASGNGSPSGEGMSPKSGNA